MFELRNVSGGYDDITVVHDVSMRFPDRSVTAIIGPNGAGKTTTLRLSMGLLKPSFGEVQLDGVSIQALPAHKRAELGICMIPEGRSVFPSLSVYDNLVVQAALGHAKAGIEEVFDAFPSLQTHLHQRAGTLSGGEQRMLALARVYMRQPRLVLVDEPSLGLAPLLVDRVFEFLHQQAERGVTLVVVEQFVERALAIADQVYVMGRGRVETCGTPAEVEASGRLIGAYAMGVTE
jgi:branched-chain amino acid transport system ATP-binding protein